MRRKDFKEIREEHFEMCNELIESKGVCLNISCRKCPFNSNNSTNDMSCSSNNYCQFTSPEHEDIVLVNSAKEFLKFKEECKMEKEKVLEVEFQDVFDDYVAWRITYQNEEVLKRGKFEDTEIKVGSTLIPYYDDLGILFIWGISNDMDCRVVVSSKEEAEIIKQKVDAINEKYGIPKRWRAEIGEKYWFIDTEFSVCYSVEQNFIRDGKRYKVGNYFKTEEEAQVKLDKIKPIFKED